MDRFPHTRFRGRSLLVTAGLLLRFEAKSGKQTEVEQFVLPALPTVREEPATTALFGTHFGGSERDTVDVFPDDDGRQAHLTRPVAQALMESADELFAAPLEIATLDALATSSWR